MTTPIKTTFVQESQNYSAEVYIDGKPVPYKNIMSLTVKEYIYSILPRVEITFLDSGIFVEHNPILEGQVIQVLLSNNGEEINLLNQTFMVLNSSITVIDKTNSSFLITVSGAFNRPGLFNKIHNKSYPSKTFSDVIKDVADANSLDHDVRIESKDKMNWYQLNQTYADFINTSIYRSYVNDDDSPFTFINRKGVLVYTSLKTAAKNKSAIIFSNDSDMATSPFGNATNERYFSSYTFSDNSGFNNNLNGGSGIKVSYYDGNKFITNEIKKVPSSEMTPYKNKLNINHNKLVNNAVGFGQLNNVYDSYFNSLATNDLVRKALLSTSLSINAHAGDYNLLDKINIEIKKDGNLLAAQSGDYLVGGIIHNINKNSRYNQMLICFRDGFGNANSTTAFKNPLREN
tara:strand:- start:881 stop:2086 length:1206 start_codon:yes stop_codon:yes gene_type:complete